MSCWFKFLYKKHILTNINKHYNMTTNREAKARIYTLEKKAKELENNGHDKEQCYRMLKVYHNQWFTVSHATQRQDLQTVLDRTYPDD